MACNDTGLKELAAAIRLLAANQCCNGGVPSNAGIQLVVNVGGVDYPVYGTQPPIDLPPGGKPEDYPGTVEEYDADKCRTAAKIVNDAILTLRAWSYLEWGVTNISIAAVIACFVGLISVPLVFIPGLIAVCIALVGVNGIITAEADWIENHKQEWICAFYQHSTVAAVSVALRELIATMITSVPFTGQAGYVARVLLEYIFSTDAINKMFTLIQGQGPEHDCSDCVSQWWVCLVGTMVSHDENSVTVEGFYGADLDFSTAVAYADAENLVQLSASLTGWTPPSDLPNFASAWDSRADACGHGNGYDWENTSSGAEEGPVTARTLQHRSNTAFTVTYTKSGA